MIIEKNEKKRGLKAKKPAQLILREKLKIGDVCRLEWLDVIGLERQTVEDLKALADVEATVSFGVVLRLMDKSLVLGHEIGDSQSDGFQVSIYPYGLINACDILGHEELKF